MLLAHYSHRLPADYDLARIRQRARTRGALWDATPQLAFKAFLLRESGQHGASVNANAYSSLYLWKQEEAFTQFLVSGKYQTVIDSFGRADIHTFFALDARKGHADSATLAVTQEIDLPRDADLTASLAREIEHNRHVASSSGVLASAVGIDPRHWRLLRMRFVSDAPVDAAQQIHEVLHLASPELASLPGA